ncbi:MAG: CHAT domain-containing protein [Chitinophagaceae bacterium]|nr:CHAT domain-containing protein [Chitinophagaceae bacterium]
MSTNKITANSENQNASTNLPDAGSGLQNKNSPADRGIKKVSATNSETQQQHTEVEKSISVSVSNGDLRYASYSILAGHFNNDGILNAEKQIDQHLQGALTERHQLALYPGEIGSSEIVILNGHYFQGTIIVGLGNFGTLTAFQLTQTVEQGVAKYLLDLGGKMVSTKYSSTEPGATGISSLIIGCGYGGLSIENSVRAIIQGVQNANLKIRKLSEKNTKSIQHIEFIELYEDTALSCFYSLSKIENEESRSLNIKLETTKIRTLLGLKQRLAAQGAEGWWNRITVKLDVDSKSTDDVRCLHFSASTGGAREEQRRLYSSTNIVEQLLDKISGNNQWTPALAKTIFELLIPNDYKEQLKKQSNINWILDKYTASYPWELLQDSAANAKPLCVNAGMIRQLTTQDYRLKINAVTQDNALVVGDPDLNGFVTQLPGAFKEGELVSALLSTNGFAVTTSLNDSPAETIKALFQADYKIIHLAGHGVFNEKSPENSGMLIGDNVYLSTREIYQMSTVPELVFVNCCYLGQTDGVAEEYFRSRYKLAANIGTQLIENGVKAVVVAGWAVDDSAALDFTRIFYEWMFEGYSFGDAVKEARKDIYNKYKKTNTWGAYQCYGDPFYKFKHRMKVKKPKELKYVIAQEAEVELNNFRNELEMGDYLHNDYLERLDTISSAVDNGNIRNARITEKEALIYMDLYEYDRAIEKFEKLSGMETSFSFSAMEKYCNIRAKKYVFDFLKSPDKSRDHLSKFDKVLNDLQGMLSLSATAERYSLLGSTYKRKAMLCNEEPKKVEAYTNAAFHYMKAHSVKPNTYALSNWLEMESILVLSANRSWNEDIKHGDELYHLLSLDDAIELLNKTSASINISSDNLNYWDMVAVANIKLCLLIIDPSAADNEKARDEVMEAYRKLWKKAGSKGKRLAEIEHLELLTDALSLSTDSDVNKLKKIIQELKTELEKMI